MQRTWARVRTFCYYNQTERNGVIAFACLIMLLFAGLWVYDAQTTKTVNATAFFAQIDSLENTRQVAERSESTFFSFNPNVVTKEELQELGFSEKQIQNLLNYRKAGGCFFKKEDFKKLYFVNDSIYCIYERYIAIPSRRKIDMTAKEDSQKKEFKLFEFNPNKLRKSQWLELGVSQKVATTIQHYLEKGGRFGKAEDLQKIYGFSAQDFQRLAPYVHIPKKEDSKEIVQVLDLNTATVQDFEMLRVRKNIAERLVKFRGILGGFVRLSQLSEVYGIKDFELELLQKHCKIQISAKQININTATSKALSKHLYLSFSDAQAIIRYREHHGEYTNVETLKTAKVLTDKVFEKVNFYLKVEK